MLALEAQGLYGPPDGAPTPAWQLAQRISSEADPADAALAALRDRLLAPPALWRSAAHAADLAPRLLPLLSTPRWGFAARLALDQALLARRLPGAPAVIHEGALADFLSHDVRFALWTASRQNFSAMHKLVIKSLPHRCQKREYAPLVQRLFAKAGDARAAFVRLVACALLGNFAHVRRPPADPGLRLAIYAAAAEPQPSAANWLHRLVLAVPAVVDFAMREYFLAAFRDLPVLRRHAARLFPLPLFQRVTVAAMDRVRGGLPTSPSVAWVESAAPALTTLLEDARTQLKPANYARDKPTFLAELQSTRVAVALPAVSARISAALVHVLRALEPTLPDAAAARRLVELLPLLGGVPEAQARLRQLQTDFDARRAGKRDFRAAVGALARQFPFSLALMRLGGHLWRTHSQTYVVPLAQHWARAQALGLHSRLRTRPDWEPGADGPLAVAEETANIYFCAVCLKVYSLVRRPVSSIKNPYEHGLRDAAVDLLSPQLEPYCVRGRQVGHLRCDAQPLARVSLLGRLLVLARQTYFLCTGPRCGAVAQLCTQRCVYGPDGFLCEQCSRAFRLERLCAQVTAALERPFRVGVRKGELGFALACDLCRSRSLKRKAGADANGEEEEDPALQGASSRTNPRALKALFATVRTFARLPPLEVAAFARRVAVGELAALTLYPRGVLLCPRHHSDALAEVVSRACHPCLTRPAAVALVHKLRAEFVHAFWESHQRTYRRARRRRLAAAAQTKA